MYRLVRVLLPLLVILAFGPNFTPRELRAIGPTDVEPTAQNRLVVFETFMRPG